MVVVADKAGRLGNKLTLFSHLIAASADSGFRVLLPAFGAYHGSFPSLDDVPVYPSKAKSTSLVRLGHRILFQVGRVMAALATRLRLHGNSWLRVIRLQEGERLDLGDPAVREMLSSTKLVVLQGWLFRDPASLSRHADMIRKLLSPSATILAGARACVEEARENGGRVVGIHVRQTDYTEHLGGRFFFPTETYVSVMEQILRMFSGEVSFLVTTDSEPDWTLFSHLPYRRPGGDVVQDMFSLAACDYMCGPPSSYSLWASFYGKTPLAMMVSSDQVLSLDDFSVAPEIRDSAVADLY